MIFFFSLLNKLRFRWWLLSDLSEKSQHQSIYIERWICESAKKPEIREWTTETLKTRKTSSAGKADANTDQSSRMTALFSKCPLWIPDLPLLSPSLNHLSRMVSLSFFSFYFSLYIDFRFGLILRFVAEETEEGY